MNIRKLDWNVVALFAGLIGFLLDAISFLVEASQGNVTKIITLRVIGILGIVFWIIWVSISIMRLQNKNKQKATLATDVLEGYSLKTEYFNGTNRTFENEVRFGHGGDSKGSDIEKVELAKTAFEKNMLKIQRTHMRYRWIMSIIRYKNTSTAPTDRYIPADTDPSVQGQYVRYIYFEFYAYVEGQAHEIYIRLRNLDGGWLRKYGTSDERASRKVRISTRSPEKFDGILGPVRADQPCYVSFDIMPGSAGSGQNLYVKDIKIIDAREQK